MLLHLEEKNMKYCEKCSSCGISCFTCIKKFSLENLLLWSGQPTLHLRDSLVTDMLPIPPETNKPEACERTSLTKIVSLATGFSGVTSPQMHPSDRLGLFIATTFRCSYLHFPKQQKYLALVTRDSHSEGRTGALRFQSWSKVSQSSLGVKTRAPT